MKRSFNISWHDGAKQFVRYVGYAIGRDGTPKPKSFYLGDDQARALATATKLRSDWLALRQAGVKVWPTAYLEAFQRDIDGLVTTGDTLAIGLTVNAVIQGVVTVDDARKVFIAEQRERMEGKQLSVWAFNGLAYRLTVAIDRLPKDIAIASRTLNRITEDDLRKVILYWSSLPKGKPRNQTKRATTGKWVDYRYRKAKRKPKREGKPISACYAKHLIKALKVFFVWCHETERWDMPRRFARLFKLKFPKVHREAEWFSVDELTALYRVCKNDSHRLWIMLGLNCGLDRMGLASLDWSMVKGLDTDTPTVERLRHKTGVFSRHVLWDETVKLLRKVNAKDRKGLVCLTERGEPLVGHKRDSVHASWRYLTVNAKVRHMSYGKLRKTGAWMTKQLGGLEVSEMYLAHVEGGLNHHYANRDWGKLDAALTVMRSKLSPMLANASGAVADAA